jgi:hypothetical protein
MSMVRLSNMPNSFARVKVKSEVSNAALECALNAFKPLPIGAPKALMDEKCEALRDAGVCVACNKAACHAMDCGSA